MVNQDPLLGISVNRKMRSPSDQRNSLVHWRHHQKAEGGMIRRPRNRASFAIPCRRCVLQRGCDGIKRPHEEAVVTCPGFWAAPSLVRVMLHGASHTAPKLGYT